MTPKDLADKTISILSKRYPHPKTALSHNNPLELLFATILSAQCTDKRVNIVTRELFKKYRTLSDYANAKQEEFEQDIRSTGFYRNKAKNIIATAKKIEGEFGGQVPDTMDDLLSLPGVARKTANVVLSNAFGRDEGIVVDTHVLRLSQRLGLTENKDPKKVEQDLMAIVPKKHWRDFSHWLILHGRETCTARKPRCPECPLNPFCPSAGI